MKWNVRPLQTAQTAAGSVFLFKNTYTVVHMYVCVSIIAAVRQMKCSEGHACECGKCVSRVECEMHCGANDVRRICRFPMRVNCSCQLFYCFLFFDTILWNKRFKCAQSICFLFHKTWVCIFTIIHIHKHIYIYLHLYISVTSSYTCLLYNPHIICIWP